MDDQNSYANAMARLSKRIGRPSIRPEDNLQLESEVESRLAIILNCPNDFIPTMLHDFLRQAKCVTPQAIVNTFGGGTRPIMSKIIQISRDKNFLISQGGNLAILRAFARASLGQPIEIERFSYEEWIKIRKTERFNAEFISKERAELSDNHEEIMESLFDEAKDRIDFIHTSILEQLSNLSTISKTSQRSTKSFNLGQENTPFTEGIEKLRDELEEIETPASQMQEPTTTEKPKSSQNQERGPKQLFTKKSSIKNQRFNLEQAAHDTTRPTKSQGRGAGFDAPVSPMDPFFHPGINRNIQGAYNVPMTDHTKFMAGTSQQGVQSRMGAKTMPFFENGEDVDDESLTEESGMENQPKRGTLLKR